MNVFYRRAVRIEWSQCDPAGIVYAPRFLDLFGESSLLMFEAAGLPSKRELLSLTNVAGFPMVDVRARFLMPASYGDRAVIETAAPVFGRSSFKIEHRMIREGDCCVECVETRVWTIRDINRPGGIRAEPVPDSVRALFPLGDLTTE